jgi:hypothetical protein
MRRNAGPADGGCGADADRAAPANGAIVRAGARVNERLACPCNVVYFGRTNRMDPESISQSQDHP